jgi:DNA-binding FrmR family transcriptional regulator
MDNKESQIKTITNFKKAKSLIEKIIKMIDEKEYCIDIMQQNLAVIGMLKSSHQMLMESHLNSCFKNAMNSKNEKLKEEMMGEIVKVTKMVNK